MNHNNRNISRSLILMFTVILLFLPIAYAVPGSWYGRVYIDGSLAPNATRVDALVNGVVYDTSYVGQDVAVSGYYSVVVMGASGDAVTFKVWNVSANEGSQSWGYGDHFLNLTMTTLANGNTCQFAGACSGGYCVHNICRAASTYCGDSYCDSGETATSCSADCGTVVGSGTSGGNGGTATATTTTPTTAETTTKEAATTVTEEAVVPKEEVVETVGQTTVEGETVTQTYNQISADSPVTFDVPVSSVSVTSVSIDTRTTVKDVEIKISKVESVPVEPPAGNVYQYLQIDKKNVENKDVERAAIKFKVPMSWINENNIQLSEVVLKRYTDRWTDISTSLVSTDSENAYYEAITSGFSYFAIGVKEEAPSAPQITGAAVSKTAEEEAKPNTALWIILGITLLVILAVIVVLMTKKKK